MKSGLVDGEQSSVVPWVSGVGGELEGQGAEWLRSVRRTKAAGFGIFFKLRGIGFLPTLPSQASTITLRRKTRSSRHVSCKIKSPGHSLKFIICGFAKTCNTCIIGGNLNGMMLSPGPSVSEIRKQGE